MTTSQCSQRPRSTILTVVVAVRNPDPLRLNRCIAGFAALRHAPRIELLLVTCGERIDVCPRAAAALGQLKIIADEPKGVYAAYNLGCLAAASEFVAFFGLDDFPLPGLDVIIGEAACDEAKTALFAGPCVSGRRVLRPIRPLVTITYRNWCHQGMVYRRTAMNHPPYSSRYPVLADHHANIRLLAAYGDSVRIVEEPVAYFSEGGLSSTCHDLEFRIQQRGIARASFGWAGVAVVDAGFAVFAVRRAMKRIVAHLAPTMRKGTHAAD